MISWYNPASVPFCCFHPQQLYIGHTDVCGPQAHALAPGILTTSEVCQPTEENLEVSRVTSTEQKAQLLYSISRVTKLWKSTRTFFFNKLSKKQQNSWENLTGSSAIVAT
jgi:hypothetical protein